MVYRFFWIIPNSYLKWKQSHSAMSDYVHKSKFIMFFFVCTFKKALCSLPKSFVRHIFKEEKYVFKNKKNQLEMNSKM